ncbi:MAG: hypothetical protein B5M53_09465, partial [Candidatus Cloacimonas sp. 4484_209]
LNDKYPDAFLNLGMIYFQEGRNDDAMRVFQKIFEIKEDYPVAYNNVGVVYLSQKKYNEAIKVFKKAIQLDPNYAEAHYNLSFTLSQLGKYDEALEETKKALEIEPYYTSNRFKLGVDLYADNLDVLVTKDISKELVQPDETAFLIDMEEEVEIPNIFEIEDETEGNLAEPEVLPEEEKNYFMLAQESIDKGNRKEAIEFLREHIRNNEKDFSALKLLANLYYNQGLWGEALTMLDKAKTLQPNNKEILYGIAKCYRAMSRNEEAENLIKSLIADEPDNLDLLSFLGELYIEEEKFNEAENILIECYKKDPKNVNILTNLAHIYEKTGRDNEAVSFLLDAKKLEPNTTSIIYDLGRLLLKTQHYEEALDEFNKVLELDENNVSCYRYLGFCYKALSRDDLAISSFKAAIDLNPLDSESFAELGSIYIEREDLKNAEDVLNKSLKIDNNPKALYYQGILSAKKGNIEDAIRKWQSVIELTPNTQNAKDAKNNLIAAQNWAKVLGKKIS